MAPIVLTGNLKGTILGGLVLRGLQLSDNLPYFDAVEAYVVGEGGVSCHLEGRSGSLLSFVKSEAEPLPVLGSHPVSSDDSGRLLHHREDIGLEVFRGLVFPASLDGHFADNSVHGDLLSARGGQCMPYRGDSFRDLTLVKDPGRSQPPVPLPAWTSVMGLFLRYSLVTRGGVLTLGQARVHTP